MGVRPTKTEVKSIIWEVDDDLDGKICKEEFLKMYKRSISDESGYEPRKFFNLVQFLMYDKEFRGWVTVEETLQILYVRHGREKLDDEIRAIFGEDEKTEDGEEKEITYSEYVININRRALEEHANKVKAKQKGDINRKKEDEF